MHSQTLDLKSLQTLTLQFKTMLYPLMTSMLNKQACYTLLCSTDYLSTCDEGDQQADICIHSNEEQQAGAGCGGAGLPCQAVRHCQVCQDAQEVICQVFSLQPEPKLKRFILPVPVTLNKVAIRLHLSAQPSAAVHAVKNTRQSDS